MLDRVSGMYGFNEPIWKLTEMKRERSGYITHRIPTCVSEGVGGGTLELPMSRLSTFQTRSVGHPAILGTGKSKKRSLIVGEGHTLH